MKKYLMTGVAALAFAATFTSCSKSGDLYDEGRIEKDKEVATKKDFASQFEAKFGTPDKNNNWGFDNVPVADLNATAKTRGANVNGNEWENQPSTIISEEEMSAVRAFFDAEHQNYTNPPVHFTDFWVQQIYASKQEYTNGNGGKVVGSEHMDELQVKKADGTWEEVNNFNGADNTDWGGFTLMVASGTESFRYNNSEDSKRHEEYIIKEINGNYYVGFDYWGNGTGGGNMVIDRNYVFNDWIVKIVPATMTNAKMIIAEDLSANNGSDFDYNDVVFTVGFSKKQSSVDWKNHLYAHITLLAAGGTMPLYVGGKANGVEVHEAFGVATNTMVNTNNGTVSKSPVQVLLDLGVTDWENTITANPKDIEVYVEGKTNLTLGTEIGQPSEKLCVDQNFQWCDEREPIETKYTRFPDWVKNRSVKWY